MLGFPIYTVLVENFPFFRSNFFLSLKFSVRKIMKFSYKTDLMTAFLVDIIKFSVPVSWNFSKFSFFFCKLLGMPGLKLYLTTSKKNFSRDEIFRFFPTRQRQGNNLINFIGSERERKKSNEKSFSSAFSTSAF